MMGLNSYCLVAIDEKKRKYKLVLRNYKSLLFINILLAFASSYSEIKVIIRKNVDPYFS
jgi:hypothetical protein